MAVTQLNSAQVKDGSINRDDLDITTSGKAVIRKIIAGTNITITETGVDSGTGDVTLNANGINILTNTITFAFPPLHEDETVVNTINSALITNNNFKSITFIPQVSVDHESLDDFQWDGLSFNIENIVDNVSFDLRATASNMTFGNYNVKYIITY